MKRIGFYTTVILFTLSSISCSSTKKISTEKISTPIRWISLLKSPCFGHCPVYRISVYKDGLCLLEGHDHIEKTGVYFSHLSAESFKKLKEATFKLDWSHFKDAYFMNLPDLPSTELIIHDENGAIIKKIKSNTNLPKEISKIQNSLSELIRTESWTQIQKKQDMLNPEILFSEIQLDMDTTLSIEKLQLEYPDFKIKAKDRISAFMNYWLITYDTNAVNHYELLVILRQKKGVRNAYFNRKILPRE